jgi:hypothetical protein
VQGSRWWWISGLAVALLGPLWSRPARAEDTQRSLFRLVWVRGERTESCAGPDAITQGVTQRLGKSVFSSSAPRSIEAVLQHEGDLWEVHIYVRDADGKLNGSRILTSRTPTCASIEAAATLAIALAIDPEAAFRPPTTVAAPSGTAPTPTPTPAPPPPPAPPLAPTPAPPPPFLPPPPPPPPCPLERPCPSSSSPAPPPASVATVALRAVAAFGLLPATAPGFALSADVPAYRWIHASAGVLYLPEQRTSDGGVAFGMTAAWLGACAQPWDSRTTLSLCANALAGGIHSVVFALEPVQPGEQAWGGASLDAVFRARLVGPLEAELGADLVIPLTRYQFAVEPQSPDLFQQPVAAGVVFVGVGMSFP